MEAGDQPRLWFGRRPEWPEIGALFPFRAQQYLYFELIEPRTIAADFGFESNCAKPLALLS